MADKPDVIAFSRDGSATVEGVGELDLFVVGRFSQALVEAVASEQEVVVDLRRSSYIDTAIVAALVAPARKLLERGGRLKVLVTEGAYPQYVLKIVGFKDLMDIEALEASPQEN